MAGPIGLGPVARARPRSATGNEQSIHQLKITLRQVSPPVWRRIQVPSNASLGELHVILQMAMGWDDGHLHVFSVRGATYPDGRVEDPWGTQPKVRTVRGWPMGRHLDPACTTSTILAMAASMTRRRAQAPGFSRGVERVTEWYNESSMRSMAPAPGLRGRSASSGMEPTSQLLCGGTGSGASGQSGSA